MKKGYKTMKRLFVLLAAVMAVAALLPAAAAHAAPPAYFQSTYTVNNMQALDIRQGDGNTFIYYRFEQVFSGDLTGTAITFQHTAVHADGSMNIRGLSTCDNCTLFGVPISTESRLEGTGNITQGVSGTWQTIAGTGQGHGTFNNVYGGTATLEGWVQVP